MDTSQEKATVIIVKARSQINRVCIYTKQPLKEAGHLCIMAKLNCSPAKSTITGFQLSPAPMPSAT